MTAELVLWFTLLAGTAGGTGQTSETTAQAAEALAIRVSPMVSREPSVVEVTVRIPASHENRVLSVEIDGGDYYLGSTVQLEGDGEPITRMIAYRRIPSANYTVTVKLNNRQGRIITTEREFQVLDRTDGPGGAWTSYGPTPSNSDVECRLEGFEDVPFGVAVCRCASGVTRVAPIWWCPGSV